MEIYEEYEIGKIKFTSYAPDTGVSYLELSLKGGFTGEDVSYELDGYDVAQLITLLKLHQYRVKEAKGQIVRDATKVHTVDIEALEVEVASRHISKEVL